MTPWDDAKYGSGDGDAMVNYSRRNLIKTKSCWEHWNSLKSEIRQLSIDKAMLKKTDEVAIYLQILVRMEELEKEVIEY